MRHCATLKSLKYSKKLNSKARATIAPLMYLGAPIISYRIAARVDGGLNTKHI